jgi:hypothetical protein
VERARERQREREREREREGKGKGKRRKDILFCQLFLGLINIEKTHLEMNYF